MKIYYAHGFTNFILPVGYKGEKIKEYFLNYASLQSDFTVSFGQSDKIITPHSSTEENWKVTIVDTGQNAETGARLKRVAPYIQSNLFLLTYGDGVADVNIGACVNFHNRHKKIVTLTGVHPPARFGMIAVHGALATSFVEKAQMATSYINGGFFVCDRRIFAFLNGDEKLNFEKNILPRIAQKRELAVFRHEGYWQCMDTLREMEFLNEEWAGGVAQWKVW